MFEIPRVALGTVQPGADLRPVAWAVLDVLRRQGLQVQGFHWRACFTDYQGAAGACGCNPRHLDSWLMPADTARDVFTHGVSGSDFALVEGRFAPAAGNAPGGRLETLCQWLDLPAVAVIDLGRADPCALPPRPEGVDAILLDRVACGQLGPASVSFEAVWGLPVIGALENKPALREAIAEVPRGARPPLALYRSLGAELAEHWNTARVDRLAARPKSVSGPSRLFRPGGCGSATTQVALAYDEAFNYYFPDTLDLLELRGATIVDFSPLRDDRLPPGTDVIYFGCGHPERFADQLADNDCIKLSLRNHVRHGGRVYAEGGGLAYLCQMIEGLDGRFHHGAGIFPAVAILQPGPSEPAPATVTLRRNQWLGCAGSELRGYRNPLWRLEPTGPMIRCAEERPGEPDIIQTEGAIGSRIHLDFAAQADFLSGFFQPLCRTCCAFGV